MPLNPRFGRTYAAAVVVALSLVPVAAQTGQRDARPNGAATVNIDNFGAINPHYYRGAQPDGRGYEQLAALGVKTIIDLTSEADMQAGARQWVERAGMTYLRIPMTTRQPPTPEQLSTFLSVVSDGAAQPVYVHCVGGRHRTGVMTAVYRMTKDGWTPDKAFKEMKRYKYGFDFLHPEFKKFVYEFPSLSLSIAAPAGR